MPLVDERSIAALVSLLPQEALNACSWTGFVASVEQPGCDVVEQAFDSAWFLVKGPILPFSFVYNRLPCGTAESAQGKPAFRTCRLAPILRIVLLSVGSGCIS
jgi:hypothetical protein